MTKSVDDMTPAEQMGYWRDLVADLPWSDAVEIVEINESADGQEATVKLRRKA
ncbi:MAG: hypothetical protein ACREEY_04685 [Brevundimonas sp.]